MKAGVEEAKILHCVYALQSEGDGKLYIGVTRDLKLRIKRHNAGGVQSTKYRRPLKLVGSKSFGSFAEAREKEVRLKRFKDPSRVRAWILS